MGGKNKSAKNSFYYFVMEYKSKYPKRFDNINDYFQAAGPLWNQMSAEERRPYEERSRREKNAQKNVKYTTTGYDISVLERNEQEKEANIQKIKDDIENTINVAVNTKEIASKFFYIIHVNYFCRYADITNKKYVPAEIAVARFTLLDGVTSEDVFHMIVEPGSLEMGYASSAKMMSEETHKIPPPFSFDNEKNNMAIVLAGLKAFMLKHHTMDKLPPVYAEEKNIPVVESVLDTLINEYGSSNETFKLSVYPLDYFFYILRNAVSATGKQVWPQLSNSKLQLEKDVYDFCADITCSFHSLSDAPNHCSKSHTMRNAYIICDNCCSELDIQLIPGRHVPKKAIVGLSRPPSRATSISSYVTARSIARQSTLKEEDYYLSTTEGGFSDTSSFIDTDELPALAAGLSLNDPGFRDHNTAKYSTFKQEDFYFDDEGASGLSVNDSEYADDSQWEQPRQRYNKAKNASYVSSQSEHSESDGFTQPPPNRPRRPVTLSAGLAGIPNSSGIRSMVGRGRGRGFKV